MDVVADPAERQMVVVPDKSRNVLGRCEFVKESKGAALLLLIQLILLIRKQINKVRNRAYWQFARLTFQNKADTI